MNLDRRLIVDDGGKRQAVAQRDSRIAFDNPGEQTAARFEAEAERQDVEQDDVFDLS